MDPLKSPCRACFQSEFHEKANFVKLADTFIHSDMSFVTYFNAFEFCSGYHVLESEPQELCSECASELRISYQFKKKCEETQNKLEKLSNQTQKNEIEEVQIKVEVSDESAFIPENDTNENRIDVQDKTDAAGGLRCRYCGKVYSQIYYLKIHCERKHTDCQVEACPYCNMKIFPEYFNFHFKKYHRDKFYEQTTMSRKEVPVCELPEVLQVSLEIPPESINSPSQPKVASKPQTKEKKPYVRQYVKALCPICGVIRSVDHTRRHMAREAGGQPYICDICGSELSNKETLYAHMKISHLNRKYECKFCHEQFRVCTSLRAHIRRLHPEAAEPLKCPMCDFTCIHHATMRTHRLRYHTYKGLLKCPQCPKKFVLPVKLNQHVRLHSDEKPFVCDTCGAAFKIKRYLIMHSKVHKEKDYECPVCQKLFFSNQLLTAHAKSKHPDYQMPPPGTIMSKSWKKKMEEKKLKDEELIKRANKKSME